MISTQTRKGPVMTFEREESREARIGADAIWSAWSDVSSWSEWNPDVERAEIDGEFAPGARIAMTLKDRTTVGLRVSEVVECECFVDEAEIEGTTVRTAHEIRQLAGGQLRVSYRLRADGPGAEQLGPAISADFGETIEGVLAHAAR
jgi:hypothetical protein